ncbi:ubiquinol oxidase [Lysobacter niastensis]|uniref:Ubiquinol oxidase n=1 Tax=Lysobacter niastensis TaxID=380629 RepID=A0ABU1WCC6_9GAMM|nr:alternative oxidase [Lysobacter niastensis]MDR7135017.1 ubiquinol oxidase [Lysobacter niastensis]
MNAHATIPIELHHPVGNLSDRVALGTTLALRFFADTLFAKRYGNRAIVLETVAAVPGMVGGALLHMRCLRWMRNDEGWIRTLLDEADNERMHLMTFMEIARPSWFERMMVLLAQALFLTFYFVLYVVSSRTAHRLVGYFEEEAVVSYTRYLDEIDSGRIDNVPAPPIAIEYWKLPTDARLREVVIAVRQDEAGHRDVNHAIASQTASTVPQTHAL